jgi:hypothetical protein
MLVTNKIGDPSQLMTGGTVLTLIPGIMGGPTSIVILLETAVGMMGQRTLLVSTQIIVSALAGM